MTPLRRAWLTAICTRPRALVCVGLLGAAVYALLVPLIGLPPWVGWVGSGATGWFTGGWWPDSLEARQELFLDRFDREIRAVRPEALDGKACAVCRGDCSHDENAIT